MQEHEMRALLGPAYDETTPEQREMIDRAATQIAERWPEPDLADTRQAALTGAMQVILGDSSLEEAAQAWHRARMAEREAQAALTGAIIVTKASETEIASRAGVHRLTVRRALGK